VIAVTQTAIVTVARLAMRTPLLDVSRFRVGVHPRVRLLAYGLLGRGLSVLVAVLLVGAASVSGSVGTGGGEDARRSRWSG
jgi:hypothetical protein